ncbi:MAG: hypothetical protein K0S80_2680, partial [Neobacillus sp.]|nr:hypothetical protein [Neobacillus sp.]
MSEVLEAREDTAGKDCGSHRSDPNGIRLVASIRLRKSSVDLSRLSQQKDSE